MIRMYCLWSSIPYTQLKKILGFVCLFVCLAFVVVWGFLGGCLFFLLGRDLTPYASYPGIVSLWGMHEC